jgi:hypothetical protein
MKKFLSAFLFLSALFSQTIWAGSSSYLQLSGRTLKTSQLKIQIVQISKQQTQVLFSTQNNSKNSDEGQKFEFEGDEDLKRNLTMKKINGDHHTSLYEIIITDKKHHKNDNQSLFLKISAN